MQFYFLWVKMVVCCFGRWKTWRNLEKRKKDDVKEMEELELEETDKKRLPLETLHLTERESVCCHLSPNCKALLVVCRKTWMVIDSLLFCCCCFIEKKFERFMFLSLLLLVVVECC